MNSKYDFSIIKDLRKELHLTQEEVANLSGLTCPTVAAVETNKGLPSLRTLDQLSEVLQISVTKLLSLAERRFVIKKTAKTSFLPDDIKGKYRLENVFGCSYGQMSCLRFALRAGERIHRPGNNKSSSMILGYLIAGKLELNVGGVIHDVEENDTVLFQGQLAYSIKVLRESEIMMLEMPCGLEVMADSFM